ncbi:MAG: RNA polymerase sigma factor [Gemmataceae bacterium]|nr:RNA polymerase sigma factor [Gemmataceae bacterium]
MADLNRAIRRTLLQLHNVGDLTDGQLLDRFVRDEDEAAFEALVRRHGPMVLRVCQRVLHHAHDAEEAFQATFIVLVRKASVIARGEQVGGWLHGVACRIALKARARAGQRQAKEQPVEESTLAEEPRQEPASELAWRELRPVLDEELSRLPDKYRSPLVLCYLEGKTNREAAQQLGWSNWTIATRLSRGRDLLRNRLTRRGLAFSVATLSALLASEASAASVATGVVVLKLATGGAAASGAVAVLAQGAINAIFWGRVSRWAVMLAAAVLLVGAGTGLTVRAMRTESVEPVATPEVDPHPVKLGHNASLGGRRPFPDDNPWNQDVSAEPVDPNSDVLIASMGLEKPLQAQFGTVANGAPHGVPYVVVSGKQRRVPVQLAGEAESDPGPYPIPPDAPIEAGPVGDPHRRLIVLDRDNWKLYELLAPEPDGEGGWRATHGCVFDLNSNKLRPWGWTSADGAGLPIFPGLIRYDEVGEQKEILHALRFSTRVTRRAFIPPARHYASKLRDPKLPPMGVRVRLRADFDVRPFPPSAQVILTCLKKYGMFLASHGQDWALSGVPDPRWNDAELRTLERVRGSDFEVVKMGKIEAGELPPKNER